MLQWFNKQGNSHSLSQKREGNRKQSPSSASALTDNDYEFLFNQLLDGVSNGWHLGKIIKFFSNLEDRSTPLEWLAWLERFEQKIAYQNDPSQRRVGAIMMRFGELTQSNSELKKLGSVFHRIGKKLFTGNTEELIWEYNGVDLTEEERNEAVALISNQEEAVFYNPQDAAAPQAEADLNPASEFTNNQEEAVFSSSEDGIASQAEANFNPEVTSNEDKTVPQAQTNLNSVSESTNNPQELSSVVPKPEIKNTAIKSNPESLGSFTEQPTQSPDFLPEPEPESPLENQEDTSQPINGNGIKSLEALTEQLTVLQDATDEPEVPLSQQTQELVTKFTEQPTQSPDLVPEPEPQKPELKNNLLESLEALTEQLTVLQDGTDEPDEPDTQLDLDSEPTLIAPETPNAASTSLSVASFLEATKALIPQQKNQITPLSWEEFVALLEQDQILAQQVAQHLKISSNNPHDIVQAAVNRFSKQQESQLSPANVELVESWFNLGLKQASAEDFHGAIASWEKVLKLNPNLSEAWHNRGSALGRIGKYEAAIQSFNRAINLAPARYQAWNDRAHALYQIQKWEQAIESWDKAISIMSDHYQFWYNRGCALEQLQRYDESISSYEKALEIKPDFQSARSRYISLVSENSSSSAN